MGMELYTGDLDDSGEFDEKFNRMLMPIEQLEKARAEAFGNFITELPEEKNTQNFFNGYMKRVEQLERLRLDAEKDLEDLESEKEEEIAVSSDRKSQPGM